MDRDTPIEERDSEQAVYDQSASSRNSNDSQRGVNNNVAPEHTANRSRNGTANGIVAVDSDLSASSGTVDSSSTPSHLQTPTSPTEDHNITQMEAPNSIPEVNARQQPVHNQSSSSRNVDVGRVETINNPAQTAATGSSSTPNHLQTPTEDVHNIIPHVEAHNPMPDDGGNEEMVYTFPIEESVGDEHDEREPVPYTHEEL